MTPTIVVKVVGLSYGHIGPNTPNLQRLAQEGGLRGLVPTTPAVTCSIQSTFVTGTTPTEHGIVGNGWYFRDLSQVWLWRQSNHLVAGEKLWDAARKRDATFTVAKMFWWYNMHADVDWSVTPRPMYPVDGRKIPDIYSQPMELRDELNARFGVFPLFNFWGPATSIAASRWITDVSLHVYETRKPTLTLIYLPHLDYDLQRLGPAHPNIAVALQEVDQLVGEIIDRATRDGARIVVLSGYGITPVHRPIHINRILRGAGTIRFREELGRELLEPGACDAFAVADHQIAHVYVQRAERLQEIRSLLEATPGIERVLGRDEKRTMGLDHPRSGELIAISDSDSWFSYYWWLDDARAPDFARTVDIHSKPGYDPVELFLDPALTSAKLAVAWRLAKKKLGFRTLMDVIPLDAGLVRGSHGRPTDSIEEGPVFLTSEPQLVDEEGPVAATDVKAHLLSHLFAPSELSSG